MWEYIKRIPVIVWIYRLFHLRYGTCNICGMPWSNCEHHDIPITKYEGFFPVCEHCWKHKSKEKNLEAVKKVVVDDSATVEDIVKGALKHMMF